VQPEALAPDPGDQIPEGAVGKAFGLKGEPQAGRAERVEGHLFLLVEEKGRFKPDRLRWEVPDRRPAFVLVRAPGEEERRRRASRPGRGEVGAEEGEDAAGLLRRAFTVAV